MTLLQNQTALKGFHLKKTRNLAEKSPSPVPVKVINQELIFFLELLMQIKFICFIRSFDDILFICIFLFRHVASYSLLFSYSTETNFHDPWRRDWNCWRWAPTWKRSRTKGSGVYSCTRGKLKSVKPIQYLNVS